jgi:hypothetical protein
MIITCRSDSNAKNENGKGRDFVLMLERDQQMADKMVHIIFIGFL